IRVQTPPDPRRPHSAITLPSLDILEERQSLEYLEPVFYFLVVQLAQPIKAELFDREGGHHAPEDDGPAERLFAEIACAGQVSHKPAGEAVPGAGRVLHLLERERGGGEDAISAEHEGAVLTALDDQRRGPGLPNRACHLHEIRIATQRAGLPVVDDEHVHVLEETNERRALALNP